MKLPDLETIRRGLRTIVPDLATIRDRLRSLRLPLPGSSSPAGSRRGSTAQGARSGTAGIPRGRSTAGPGRAATRAVLRALTWGIAAFTAMASRIRASLRGLPGLEAMGRAARRLARRLPGPAEAGRSLRTLVAGAAGHVEAAGRGWAGALVRGRCPRCLAGDVFRGLVSMNERCPRCELKFEREPGYFVAAMYLSYGAAVVVISAFYWSIAWLLPQASFEASLAAATLLFMPLVPAVFQYSRVLWIYIDRTIDAPRSTEASEEPR